MTSNKCNVEVFARVTGFFRPVQSWNKGKTAEFKDRKKYKLNASKVEDENSRLAKSVVD